MTAAAETWVRFDGGWTNAILDPMVHLDGVPLRDGDVLRLGAGAHRLRLSLTIGSTNPWGRITCRPRFVVVPEEAARTAVARLQEDAAERQAAWEDDRAYHQANGGASPRFRRLFGIGEGLMHAFYRHCLGTGGFTAGAVNPMFNVQGPMRYAAPYRNMFGRDLSGGEDITRLLPRLVMPLVYGSEGRPRGQAINGDASFDLNGWFEARDAGPEAFALLLPVSPPAWQPALHWAWNRHVGIAGEADVLKVLVPGGLRGGEFKDQQQFNTFPLYAFLRYPLGETPQSPKAAALPLDYEAVDHGWSCFRNRWQDGDDAVLQVFAKQRASVEFAPENAGAWRLMALGKAWATGPQRHDDARMMDNCVVLPDDDTCRNGLGRITHRCATPDDGALTIDLAGVYARKTGKPTHTGYGSVALPREPDPAPITGLRAIAVDYSGKSGAPVLVALLDRIEGATSSLWLHQLASITEPWGTWDVVGPDGKAYHPGKDGKSIPWQGRGKLPEGWQQRKKRDAKVPEVWTPDLQGIEASASANGFSIVQGEARLDAVFAPAPGLKVDRRTVEVLECSTSGHSYSVSRVASHALTAATPDGTYFVVMTVGRSDPPPVTVAGHGLDAVFSVGQRRVRWDGTRLIIETAR